VKVHFLAEVARFILEIISNSLFLPAYLTLVAVVPTTKLLPAAFFFV